VSSGRTAKTRGEAAEPLAPMGESKRISNGKGEDQEKRKGQDPTNGPLRGGRKDKRGID